MTQQHATVTAVGSKEFATGFAARMRNQPWLIGRIQFFTAKAIVVARNLNGPN